MEDEEIWKQLKIEHFERYKISNKGRLLNKCNKIIKPQLHNGYWVYYLRSVVDGVKYRSNISINRLVVEYFTDIDIGDKLIRNKEKTTEYKPDNYKVNIYVEPNETQKQLFNDYFYKFALSEIKKNKYNNLTKLGFDLDNAMQDTALKLYQFIGATKIQNWHEFYQVVRKTFRYTILDKLKKWRRTINLDYLFY